MLIFQSDEHTFTNSFASGPFKPKSEEYGRIARLNLFEPQIAFSNDFHFVSMKFCLFFKSQFKYETGKSSAYPV